MATQILNPIVDVKPVPCCSRLHALLEAMLLEYKIVPMEPVELGFHGILPVDFSVAKLRNLQQLVESITEEVEYNKRMDLLDRD